MPGPRLLLFGLPDAGKSSLLEKGLHEKGAGPFFGKANVLECDAKAALQLLESDDKAVLEADAVMIIADVSLTTKQLTDQFRQSAQWLKRLHELRGERADIADLPVYFVLTKCDLLAKKDDTHGAWIKRVEEIKHRFADNFRNHLKMERFGFGTIKLMLFATATKAPNLADATTKGHEPLGVAELFRECTKSANDFRDRRQTAQGRLQNVAFGLIGLVVLLGLSVLLLAEFQPPPRSATLDEKLQVALPRQGASALERVQGTVKKLKEREAKLAEIEADPEFALLPSETRAAVTSYRKDLADYLRLEQDAQTTLKLPHLAKNDAELKEQETLANALRLPDEHKADWADSRVGNRLRKVTGEYLALHAALDEEKMWVRGQIEKNQELFKAGNSLVGKLANKAEDLTQEAKEWHRNYQAQMNARPPMPRDDNVPGVSQLIYDDLARFEPLRSARKEWRESKESLTSMAALIK